MTYDYRKYIIDDKERKIVASKMNKILGDKRFSSYYQKMEEDYEDSRNKLYALLKKIKSGDEVYVYDSSHLGDTIEESLSILDEIQHKGAEIVECINTEINITPNINADDPQKEQEVEEAEPTGKNQNHTNSNDQSNIPFDINGFKETPGYQWLCSKVKQGSSSDHLLFGFNTLFELNPTKYSLPGGKPMDETTLAFLVKTIKGESCHGPEMTYEEWKQKSVAYKYIKINLMNGQTDDYILKDFNAHHLSDPTQFSIYTGDELDSAFLSKIKDEVLPKPVDNTEVYKKLACEIVKKEICGVIKEMKINCDLDFFLDYQDGSIKVELVKQ